jgi:hypothetical protein
MSNMASLPSKEDRRNLDEVMLEVLLRRSVTDSTAKPR